MTMQNIYT